MVFVCLNMVIQTLGTFLDFQIALKNTLRRLCFVDRGSLFLSSSLVVGNFGENCLLCQCVY